MTADDRKEMRERLDEAAQKLAAVNVGLLDLRSQLRKFGLEVAAAAKNTVELTRFRAEEAEKLGEMLRIRLGAESAIPAQLEAAAGSLREFVEACEALDAVVGIAGAEATAERTEKAIAEARTAFHSDAPLVLDEMLRKQAAAR